jgi:hypothetical protein
MILKQTWQETKDKAKKVKAVGSGASKKAF